MACGWITLGSTCLATGFALASGCSEPKAPTSDGAPTTLTLPSAPSSIASEAPSVTSSPAESAPLPMAVGTAPAPPPLVSTVGDGTCSQDSDCAITTRQDCCECCASNPRATSRAWLAWRDGTQCPSTRCDPCGKVKCRQFDSVDAFVAKCEAGQCALVAAAP